MYKPLLAFLFLVGGCATPPKQQVIVSPPEKANFVYHIQPDALVDDPTFTLCDVNTAYPYYGTDTHVKRDKREILEYFNHGYRKPETARDNGYVCIRFIVNCMGVAGRFRLEEFDKNYQPTSINSEIKVQLLDLTRNVKDWQPIIFENQRTYDSYCYFLFKIENGNLTDVLP